MKENLIKFLCGLIETLGKQICRAISMLMIILMLGFTYWLFSKLNIFSRNPASEQDVATYALIVTGLWLLIEFISDLNAEIQKRKK